VSRGALLLAVALTLALSPAAAAGQAEAQPDVIIVGRHGTGFTGDNVYNADGVGQQREVIVDRRAVVVVRIQNDGGGPATFVECASPASAGFSIRYELSHQDISEVLTRACDLHSPAFRVRELPGRGHTLRIHITADRHAQLGALQNIVITAVNRATPTATDTVKIEITKTSTPE
jgi:hypothetical protein